MFRMIKRAKDKLARVGSATKGAVVAVGSTVGATASQAALTVDPLTGVISGSMEMAPFYGGATVTAVAIGATIAVFLGIGALKKAK